MRIALLSGANPKIAKIGPRVRLVKGSWRIECEGMKDSKLYLTLTSKPFLSQDEDVVWHIMLDETRAFNIDVPATVQVGFKHWGTEPLLTITACKVA